MKALKNRKDNRQGFGELAENIYFILLPLLCIASLMRGCGARSAQIPEAEYQTASEQQYVTKKSGETEPAQSAEPEEAAKPEEKTGETVQEEVQAVESDNTVQETESVPETPVRSAAERKNPYDPGKFSYIDEISENITYLDENYEALQGIDVSDHQGVIDWNAVADAGYDFVFVRVGFRGYGEEGTLNEDAMAIEYMQDAEKAGLEVGAYFFSQAVDEEEAAEEARFAADIVKRSGVKMTLPLVYDPELAGGSKGRANNLSRDQVCSNARAFKRAAEEELHCKVALYTNLFWENTYFDVGTLDQFEIWYADYEPVPQTNYTFTWWQYTETGSVPGIKGAMDLNLWIKRVD